MKCEVCEKKIPAERLKAVPHTLKCVTCAAKYPEQKPRDPEVVCAASSATGRNGFAKND